MMPHVGQNHITSSNIQRPNNQGMNHFMPVLQLDKLDAERVKSFSDELQAEHQKHVDLKAHAWRRMIEGTGAVSEHALWKSSLESSTARINMIERLVHWNKLLALKGLVCFEVPAEGNCGIYSVLAQEAGEPLVSTQDDITLCRAKIASAWCEAAKTTRWRQLYADFVAEFDEESNNQPDSSIQKEVKKEITPKKKKKKLSGRLAFLWDHLGILAKYENISKQMNTISIQCLLKLFVA